MGEHGKRDVPVPANPTAHFVLIQTDVTLGGLEAGFDGPASAGDLYQIGERCRFWGMDQVESEVGPAGDGTADQETLLPAIGGHFFRRYQSPIVETGAFGAIACAVTVPILCRQSLGETGDRLLLETLVVPDPKHVAAAILFDQPTQPMVATVNAITGHPGAGYASRKGAGQHAAPERWLGRKTDRGRYAGLGAACSILGPTLRQVQRSIDQGMPVAAGIT